MKISGEYVSIDTKNTTLLMKKVDDDLLTLYYGNRLIGNNFELFEGQRYNDLSERRMREKQSFSFIGGGDVREPSIIIKNFDGSFVNKFKYTKSYLEKKYMPNTFLPYAKDSLTSLVSEYYDEESEIIYRRIYSVFKDSDIIAVNCEIENLSNHAIHVLSASSVTLDLEGTDYDLTTFSGAWGRERWRTTNKIKNGIFINDSKTGSSSPYRNPFIMLKRNGIGNSFYAFNLIYSGSHKESVEQFSYNNTRVNVGINDFCFDYILSCGETFISPQALMIYSESENDITKQMHYFVNNNIIPCAKRGCPRPIVYNSWESVYFNFTEDKLIGLAEKAKALGIELFVLDDGWFRDDDKSNLGDWKVCKSKFKNGLADFAKRIHGLGLKFGLWFEPESISEKSELYNSHPDYAMVVPRKTPIRIRNQLLLDLTNDSVTEYLYGIISDIVEKVKLDYIKWDFNRYMTDRYSPVCCNNGEYEYRYYCGLYKLLKKITDRFPNLIIESCASGGSRFDLGMLSFSSYIWCSDNTDARERIFIQEGTLCGYPQSVLSAHVSASPNHQTGNKTSIENRFNIAAVGCLGYELDFDKCSETELDGIKRQIAFYKRYIELLQFGEFLKIGSAYEDDLFGYMTVSDNKRTAICVVIKLCDCGELGINDFPFRFAGLSPNIEYNVCIRNQVNKEKISGFRAYGQDLCSYGVKIGKFLKETDRENNSNSIRSVIFVFESIECLPREEKKR